MNIGIDHGYYAIKTRHLSFPAGITEYSHEPYTLQNTLEYGGKYFVCGTGRQPILRNKMENNNYYVRAIKKNPIAVKVKRADLVHNSDKTRFAGCEDISADQLIRWQEKYAKARAILEGVNDIDSN